MLASTAARRMAGFAATAALSLALLMPAPALADAGFRNWIASFRTTAVKAGVSGAIYDRAFRGIDAPDPEVLQKARYQPEFTAPAWDYFDNRVHDQAIANGRALARQWKPWLDRIEQRYGVDRYTLLAIWSMESNYGETLKRTDIMRSVVRSLATLGYGDPKRSKYARTQLIAALKILQTGDIDESHLSGSWAGAMGHTQFIPTSYQSYAVDMDGNGKRDIWNSVPDVLGSIANYLDHYGWVKGRGWGFEVTVPATVSCSLEGPDQGKKIADWAAMGIKRVGGKPFPAAELKAEGFLLMPAGRSGPAFVVTPNFYVIKQYNNSDLYGLFISHAADRIASGDSNFAGKWGDVGGLLRSDIAALQRALEAKGYDVGSADGLPGFKTRRSIGKWQAKNGRPATCFPEADLVSAVK